MLRDVDVEKTTEETSDTDNGITRCYKDKIVYTQISRDNPHIIHVKRNYCGSFKMAEDSVPLEKILYKITIVLFYKIYIFLLMYTVINKLFHYILKFE